MAYDYPIGFSHWSEEERAAIARVVESGWFTYGPEVEAFERELADFHSRKYAVMVGSGSSANWVAVATLFHLENNPLRRGDIAAVPAIAWSTTYSPLIQHGLDLIIKDVDSTWNADWNLPNWNNSDKGIRLVVTCPVLGNPLSYENWQKLLSGCDWGGYWIDDACESVGAFVGHADKKQYCGSFGIMSTVSFFMSHQISAIEGGAILTDDPECYRLARILRNHGWTRDVAEPQTFSDEYRFVAAGMNVRPLEMHAAIAREQLKKQDIFRYYRQRNWKIWHELTEELPITHPLMIHDYNPFGLHFTVKDTETRSKLAAALRAQSIDCRLPTGGSFRMHEFARPWSNQQTPNADYIHLTGMFLGNAPFDISDKIERAVKVIREVLT